MIRVATLSFTFFYSLIYSLKPNPWIFLQPLYTKWPTSSTLAVLCPRLYYKPNWSFLRQQNLPSLCPIKRGLFFNYGEDNYTLNITLRVWCVSQRSEDNLEWLLSPSIMCSGDWIQVVRLPGQFLKLLSHLLTHVFNNYPFKMVLRIALLFGKFPKYILRPIIFPDGVRDIGKDAQVDWYVQCTFRSA